jgi:DNA helicase-2/ATP-dependent DNA helicase PcrA
LQRCAPAVPKKAAVGWAQLSATLAQIEAEEMRTKPSEMIRTVVEAGYEEYLEEEYPNATSRLEDLEQLASFGLQFNSTEEFLTQLALLSNVEAEDEKPAQRDEEQMRLSTVHQAKGLEFGVVFVIMLCDGLFPAVRSLESLASEEEERRLFYVAVTRAKNELYLSYPLVRPSAAYTGEVLQAPSRFIHDLPPDLVEEWNLRPYNPFA